MVKRISAEWTARMPVIARALPTPWSEPLRSPPKSGVGWWFGAIGLPGFMRTGGAPATTEGQRHPLRGGRSETCQVLFEQPLSDILPGGSRPCGSAFRISTIHSRRRQDRRSTWRSISVDVAGGLRTGWRGLGGPAAMPAGIQLEKRSSELQPPSLGSGWPRRPAFPSASGAACASSRSIGHRAKPRT